MRFPRYNRKDDARWKLTKDQVAKIQKLSATGFSQRKLAKMFGVCKTTIMRHISSEQRTKLIDRAKLYVDERRKKDPEAIALIDKKRSLKKRKIMHKEINQYYKEKEREYFGWAGRVNNASKSFFK